MSSSRYIQLVFPLILTLWITGCQTSNAVKFSQNESGVYLAHKSSIPMGAVRLTINLTSDVLRGDGYYYANAEVVSVDGYGASFTTQRPRKGDQVIVNIMGEIKGRKFKSGDLVKLDAMTPLQNQGDLLTISML